MIKDPMLDLSEETCWLIVYAIRDILYLTPEGYDPDKEWDVEMLERIADALDAHTRLSPTESVEYE